VTNREKYNKAFIDCFSVTEDMLNEDFVYQCSKSDPIENINWKFVCR